MKKNTSFIFSLSISILMCIQNVCGKVSNGTNTEYIEMEEKIKHLYKLRAPVAYTLEDLMMSLTILLLIFGMMVVWYGFARCIIYLVYHRADKSIPYFDGNEEDPVWS